MLNEGIFRFDKITIVPNMRAELIEKKQNLPPWSAAYWETPSLRKSAAMKNAPTGFGRSKVGGLKFFDG